MRAGRAIATTGVIAGIVGLVAIATAHAQSLNNASSAGAPISQPTLRQIPIASAAGGGATALVYPSVVAVHLDRSASAVARAEAAFDDPRNTVRVGNQMSVARTQMIRAWQATKYVIKT